MKPQNLVKKEYLTPGVEKIKLDNEISLILESTPPAGPNETYLKLPECMNNDPFKENMG